MELDRSGCIPCLETVAQPLTREHIFEAVDEFEKKNHTIESYSHSTTYDLIVKDKTYPPKAILGLALSRLLQEQVISSHFAGGLDSPCFSIFESLDFEIRIKDNRPWPSDELKISVEQYLSMLSQERKHIKFNKAEIYRQLSHKFKRSVKSYEFRMQNISYVFELLGRQWVKGLKPKRNITAQQVQLIEQFIAEIENSSFTGEAAFEAEVRSLNRQKNIKQPEGIAEPSASDIQTTAYARDPHVKAWILQQAHGVCESCGVSAPFMTEAGEPFLEVHHLRRLADGGSDTIFNAVALCPNCHRELHYGVNRERLLNKIYARIARLKRE